MFTLPDLPYDYSALEPFIDTETMRIHHDKHHGTYVKNLNDALAGHDVLLGMNVNDLILKLNEVPDELRIKVKNNAGGHANHSLFWQIMGKPTVSGHPSGKLSEAINANFGDYSTFQEKFSAEGLGRFGSGWAWLVVDNRELSIVGTSNQDTPVSEGKTPILLLDVWEHAYYLKYKNMRTDYIKAWWNVVDWNKVAEYYEEVIKK